MDDWMPLHLSDGVFAALNLKVGEHGALVSHEEDAGLVCGHSEHYIDFAAGPGRQETLLVVLHLHQVVKEHCHLYPTLLFPSNLSVCL